MDCFTEDYVNETPAHPARGFRGRDPVRRNWTQIFAAVPDIEAELLRSHQAGDTVWLQWEMRDTRKDEPLPSEQLTPQADAAGVLRTRAQRCGSRWRRTRLGRSR